MYRDELHIKITALFITRKNENPYSEKMFLTKLTSQKASFHDLLPKLNTASLGLKSVESNKIFI